MSSPSGTLHGQLPPRVNHNRTNEIGVNKSPDTAVVAAIKALPLESSSSIWTRRYVVLSFWAVVALLGLPIWWHTTTVYRAKLPLQSMLDWSEGKMCSPTFPLHVILEAPSLEDTQSTQLLWMTQQVLDALNDFPAHHISLRQPFISSHHGSNGIKQTHNQRVDEEPPALTVKLTASQDAASPSATILSHSPVLSIEYPPSMVSTSISSLSAFIANQVQDIFSEEKATLSHILAPGAAEKIPTISKHPSLLRTTVEDIQKRTTRSVKYAPTYHLTFSLFTPQAAPSAWEIEAVLAHTLQPLLESLSSISNFTIDTQVQPYSTFSSSVQPIYDEAHRVWTLSRADLGGFINAAEWPLSPSIGAGPTIHFVLYVPDERQSPLVIVADDDGSLNESGDKVKSGSTTTANSWIVPQWGGIAILNPSSPNSISSTGATTNPSLLTATHLHAPILTFSRHLLSLLGLPSTPKASLTLRLSALTRLRTTNLLLSASSTLGSLARLTVNLPSISIPDSVAKSVQSTQFHLEASCSALKSGRFNAALDHARLAEGEVEKAFFERSMVGQVYFPEEHKVAVYLPLLGPVAVPLVMSALREITPVVQGWVAVLKGRAGRSK